MVSDVVRWVTVENFWERCYPRYLSVFGAAAFLAHSAFFTRSTQSMGLLSSSMCFFGIRTALARRTVEKLEDANKAGTRESKDCTLILTEGDSAKALAVSGTGGLPCLASVLCLRLPCVEWEGPWEV